MPTECHSSKKDPGRSRPSKTENLHSFSAICQSFLRTRSCGPGSPRSLEGGRVRSCAEDKKTRSLGLRPPRRYPSGQSVSLPLTSVDEPQVDLRPAKSRLRRPTAPNRAKLKVTLLSSQTKFAMSQQMSAPGLTPKSPSALLKPLKTFKDVVAGKKRPPRVLRAGTEYP